ncbi:growth hormone secretagogue receptor type 1 isoform X2 [Neodiprion pinetum]|uniref:Growth hormone secretagogue receptor type 1 isoform X2 n=1 Tax=Neodiprion lecontei TaxID=441921 RepID=A0ABM3GLQ4_NEOLC|nr:growth hormone secretagogue receptor type 1-like isoform X2 [Neodiprion fabricii]XP_046490724.1 growth hormone secretagogue receptor type 1-like isoform X2 [Neodiprion pinetum]XP_046601178.1 growth hormone secretagogue receptor type 1 isoform X2 [Neodiprion lecontei]
MFTNMSLGLNSSYYPSVITESTLSDGSLENGFGNATMPPYMLPAYIRTTSMIVCILVMVLGVVGNLMVPLVVFRGKDMRNSTNIFLVNLSVADLCVLLVCAPTVLVEVNSRPEIWALGEHMCKAVPFVELTVAHASVLTILAISFERYYAICEPLRAGYVCTKARATCLCFLAWAAAALCTSPIVFVTKYENMAAISAGVEVSREEKTVAMCETQMNSSAKVAFMLVLTILFFVLPLFLLLGLYLVIVRHLVKDSSTTSSCGESYQARARRQVVLMLLTVVFSFFVCLAPFRLLTLFVVLSPDGALDLGMEAYYNLLYFGRIMFYLNSAINPILYNLMSSRFRIGFLKLCGIRKPRRVESNTFRSTVTASRPSRWATRKEGHHENVV